MRRGAGLACMLLGALLGAAAARAAPARSFAFAVVGHNFPGDSGDDDLKRTMARASRLKPAFVIAAGLKSPDEPCTDKLYGQRRALLNRSEPPLVLVLAGGDWTECRNSAGRSNAIERLNRIREMFFDGREALGERPLDLYRQSTIAKFRSYAENAYWEKDSVLFATINLPAHNNHFLPEAGRNSEYEDRLVANRAWLQRLFSLAKRRQLDGLVLFSDGDMRAHIDPGFSLLSGFSAKQDGFAEPRRLVRTLAEKYPGKVLLVDTSREPAQKGDPVAGTVTWRGNLGHVSLKGEWNVVRVAPGTEPLFALQEEHDGQQEPSAASGKPKLPAKEH
jgi:hypothetical protein